MLDTVNFNNSDLYSMSDPGKLSVEVNNGVGILTFSHTKSNSLPGTLLREIAQGIAQLGEDKNTRVILLKSEGEKVFCAGASFDEFKGIQNVEQGREFFMGFGLITLAVRKCPKLVVARVQGKAVGGGVGIVAASDIAFATNGSAVRLSELALGIGPFIIGPAVQRKIGLSAYSTLAVEAEWRDAKWAKDHGLYAETFDTVRDLDAAVKTLTEKLAGCHPAAMARLKQVLWEGTENWESLLPTRAGFTAELALTDYVQSAIAAVKER